MGRLSTISFPGLGIGEFTINAEAISFEIFGFPITIMWYALIICAGIVAAFLYFHFRARQMGVSSDDILDITLVTVLCAIVGARLYFLIFYGNFIETSGTFWENVKDTLYNIVAVWNGGLAIYGGILVGALTVFLMARHKKFSFFKLADAAAPGVMLGQLIGRWGNFCNGEAYGARVSSDYFLAMGLQNLQTATDFGVRDLVYVHPTFLYESLWNLIGFILINVFYKRRKFDGEAFLWYVGWYGLGRTFIELLRTDSLMLGPFRVSSLLSLLLFVVTLPLIICLSKRYRHLVAAGELTAGEIVSPIAMLRKKPAATENTVEAEASEDTEAGVAEETKAEASEDAEAGVAEETKAEAAEETNAEASEDTEAGVAEETKAEAAEETKTEAAEENLTPNTEEKTTQENEEPEEQEKTKEKSHGKVD